MAAKVAAPKVGTANWAIAQLLDGNRIKQKSRMDNKHFDPAHIRGGLRMTYAELMADDWEVISETDDKPASKTSAKKK
ncbi:MAG: hypothetical protein AAGD43_04695 [Pseudomonadota bacterium]